MGKNYDCIVMGAGISGLVAARKLHNAGKEILVVEGSQRIGGRLCTDYSFCGEENPVEAGAEFIHGARKAIPEVEQIALQKIDIPENVMMKIDSYCDWQTNFVLFRPQLWSTAFFLPNIMRYQGADISAKEFLQQRKNSNLASKMEDFIISGHCPGPLEELSIKGLQLDHMPKMMGGKEKRVLPFLPKLFLGDTWYRLKEGYEKLVASIATSNILLEKKIVKVSCWDSKKIEVATEKGEKFCAKSAICTFSIGMLGSGEVHFVPALPPSFQKALSKIKMGAVTKIIIKFRKVFWPRQMAIFGCPKDCENMPAITYWAPFFGREFITPVLTAYATGPNAQKLASFDDPIEVITAHLQKLFPKAKNNIIATDFKRFAWEEDLWSKGGYSFLTLGLKEGENPRKELIEAATGNLFWAGEAVAQTEKDIQPTSVHGAYSSGLHAAQKVLTYLDTKE